MLGILGLIQVAKYLKFSKHLIPTTPIIYYLYIRTGFRVGLCVSLYYWCRSIVFGHGPLRKKKYSDQLDFRENYIGPKLANRLFIHHEGETLTTLGPNGNPFYLIMADWFQPIGIIIATLAAVIASQALISGSFT
jgi:KUP system potassium uptake protein